MKHAVVGLVPTLRRVLAALEMLGGRDRIGDYMKSKMSTHTRLKMEHQLQDV